MTSQGGKGGRFEEGEKGKRWWEEEEGGRVRKAISETKCQLVFAFPMPRTDDLINKGRRSLRLHLGRRRPH